ncbi:MAG: hypothetical protein H7Z39_02060 [Burkholderiaceae bacterium]|nr:hypothetical protein [Burkholderiaceae bacterium]
MRHKNALGHLRMPEHGNRQDIAGPINPNHASFLDQLAYPPVNRPPP